MSIKKWALTNPSPMIPKNLCLDLALFVLAALCTIPLVNGDAREWLSRTTVVTTTAISAGTSALVRGKNPMTAAINAVGTSNAIANPRMKAFLDTIAWAEGTFNRPNSGYQTLFGGGQFFDMSKHPNQCIAMRDGRCSTAAGRYQILNKTADSLGMSSFSSQAQDLAAVELIRSRGALDDVLAGRFDEAAYKVGGEWASFPNNSYGQPQKSLELLREFYNQRLQGYLKRR